MAARDAPTYPLGTHGWLRNYQRSVADQPGMENALGYFQQMYEAAPSAFVVTDALINIIDANRAAVQLLQLARSDLRGKSLADFVSAPEQGVFRQMAAEVISAPLTVVRPICVRTAKAREIDMTFSATSIRDTAGTVNVTLWLFCEAHADEQMDLA